MNGFAAVLALAGTIFAMRSGQFDVRGRICLLAMLACMFAFISVSGKRYIYMYYIWGVFAPLGLLPVLRALKRWKRGWPKRIGRAVWIAALCVCVLSTASGRMVSRIGYPREKLTQARFAEEMRRVENPELLNCGFLDTGFYLAADALPQQRWFCQLNMMRNVSNEVHKRYIESGAPDYVVMRDEYLSDHGISDEKYEVVMEIRDTYSALDKPLTYRLYRRKDIA